MRYQKTLEPIASMHKHLVLEAKEKEVPLSVGLVGDAGTVCPPRGSRAVSIPGGSSTQAGGRGRRNDLGGHGRARGGDGGAGGAACGIGRPSTSIGSKSPCSCLWRKKSSPTFS